MSLYEIEQGKIDALEKSLEYTEPEQRKEVFKALDGIIAELEADAFIAKQSSGNPSLIFNAMRSAEIVAERIYFLREYLQRESE